MASKSKDVRIEQLRIFEKKLAQRMEQLAQQGISKEKTQRDPLVKSLKSKIRETNVRIAAFEKFVQLNQKLAQAKAQKLAEPATKKEEKSGLAQEAKKAESKAKKKEAVDKEPKKQTTDKAEKEPKKQAAAEDETTSKKPKKQPADADEAAPKKRASKQKEE
jgi:hypothetical protein